MTPARRGFAAGVVALALSALALPSCGADRADGSGHDRGHARGQSHAPGRSRDARHGRRGERGADRSVAERDRALIAQTLAGLAPQRPGHVDLYVLGFAGDGGEDVFRNEVRYLDTLMSQRFGAEHRVVTLVNHIDSLGDAPRPLATLDNLRLALAGLGKVMDPGEDLLLLFLTSHGTEDHTLVADLPPVFAATIDPPQLRAALDASGIRHRVVVVSACYSGGFVPALRSADTLVITAARADRTSFGCGSDAKATYFGRAFLVDGLNRADGFIGAYDIATAEVARWEREDGELPSMPQIDIGARIGAPLRAWQAQTAIGAPVAYPEDH